MKRVRHAFVLTSLGCTAALLGCMGLPVETDFDPEVEFGALSSYAWLEVTREKTGDPRLDNDLLDRRVRRSVDAALAAKGYTLKDARSADFEIAYHVGVEKQLDVQTYVDSYGYGYRGRAGLSHSYTSVREYDVGSLVLDFVDPSRSELIWRGSTQARVHEDGTPEQREQRVREAVDAILAKFPPL